MGSPSVFHRGQDARWLSTSRRLWLTKIIGKCRAFRDDARAAMAITMGFFMVLLMGMGVLALDVGRMMVIEVQMKNAADAAAFAAAVQLTGADGSRVLADAVARNAAQQITSFIEGTPKYTIRDGTAGMDGNTSLNTGIQFYQSWDPGDPGSGVLATTDTNAVIVRVEMKSELLTLVLQPIIDILTGAPTPGTTVHTAYAVAQNAATACETPPLMICNPFEDPDAVAPCGTTPYLPGNILGTENIGKMIVAKEGPGGVASAPGEFGLLCTADGECGANAIEEALSDPSYSPDCLGPIVQTSPGSKTNKIVWGINVRFDKTPTGGQKPNNDPAPNITDYPKDKDWDSSVIFQSGEWDPLAYLSGVTHPFSGSQLEGTTINGVDYPTRYQVYLWEIGVPFEMNGPVTTYPVGAQVSVAAADANPTNTWETVNLGASGLVVNDSATPFGVIDPAPALTNIPSPLATTPSTQTGDHEAWVKWRTIRTAVLDCVCLGVAGNGNWNSFGRYIDWFITEAVTPPSGSDSAKVYAEFMGAPATGPKNQTIVKSVRLIE